MFGYFFDVFKLDIEGKLPDSFGTKFVSSAYSDASLGHSKKKAEQIGLLLWTEISTPFSSLISYFGSHISKILWLEFLPTHYCICLRRWCFCLKSMAIVEFESHLSPSFEPDFFFEFLYWKLVKSWNVFFFSNWWLVICFLTNFRGLSWMWLYFYGCQVAL